jgi:hypothetical protein
MSTLHAISLGPALKLIKLACISRKQAFIDAIGSNRRGAAGRGGNAYSRFLNANKETVLEEEKPQVEYFNKQRKYQRGGRFSNADDDDDE